jgi:hypothetical protein
MQIELSGCLLLSIFLKICMVIVVFGKGIFLFTFHIQLHWQESECRMARKGAKFWQIMCESFSILSLKIDAGTYNGTVRICSQRHGLKSS